MHLIIAESENHFAFTNLMQSYFMYVYERISVGMLFQNCTTWSHASNRIRINTTKDCSVRFGSHRTTSIDFPLLWCLTAKYRSFFFVQIETMNEHMPEQCQNINNCVGSSGLGCNQPTRCTWLLNMRKSTFSPWHLHTCASPEN